VSFARSEDDCTENSPLLLLFEDEPPQPAASTASEMQRSAATTFTKVRVPAHRDP
jgi:hypothetical protein